MIRHRAVMVHWHSTDRYAFKDSVEWSRHKGLPGYGNWSTQDSSILTLVRTTSKSNMTITYAHKVKFTNVILIKLIIWYFRWAMLEELGVSLNYWHYGGEASISWCTQSKSILVIMLIQNNKCSFVFFYVSNVFFKVSDMDNSLHGSKLSL